MSTPLQPAAAGEVLSPHFVDVSGAPPAGPEIWPALKVSREQIEAEIERLSAMPLPANGRRGSSIVHPHATAPGVGLAPGVDVTINVLNPGEETRPLRRNANQVEICIRGAGTVHVAEQTLQLEKWDVCNIPSMRRYSHRNDGDDIWVRLTYSNSPLLQKLGVPYFEDDPEDRARDTGAAAPSAQAQRYARDNAPDIPISDTGARLRGYEFLTDIEVVENLAHHWPWKVVSQELSHEVGDNRRNILLLYNPATERRNGTTHSFFVTASGGPPRPANAAAPVVGRGHRHSSVAINYHFKGSGKSVVDGRVIEWGPGDLVLSAPGWSEHAHYGVGGPEGSGVFTVQDHPQQIGMESLIWQERMDGPILALGSEAGQTGYVGPRAPGA